MRRRHTTAVILTTAVWFVLAVAALTSAAPAGTDWRGWRGPERDGKSADTGLLKQWPQGGPRQLWHDADIGQGFSSVAVADEAVYITGAKDGKCLITCFDLGGGRKWQIVHGPAWTGDYPGSRATPLVDDGRLYVLSGPGKLGCYHAATGREIWTVDMSQFAGKRGGWGYAASPLIVGDLLVISPGGKQCLVALDKKTGRPRWISPGNGSGAHYGSPIYVVHDGVPMIVHGNQGGLFAVNADNGRVLWTNEFGGGNTANCPTPSYRNGYVFWANGYGVGGICLKLESDGQAVSAHEAYRTKDMDCHHGGYVIHEGYVYGNDGGGWNCLELATGRKVWRGRGPGKGSLCFADGMLYLFGEGGGKVALAAATPDGLKVTGSFRVKGSGPSWAHPVVTGGRLYLRYGDNLYCFDVTAKQSAVRGAP